MFAHLLQFRTAMLSSQCGSLGTLPVPEPGGWLGAVLRRIGRPRRGERANREMTAELMYLDKCEL